MNIKVIFVFLLLLGVSSASAQTPQKTRPELVGIDVRELPPGSFMVSNWFNAGMMLETLEVTPSLRYFQPR